MVGDGASAFDDGAGRRLLDAAPAFLLGADGHHAAEAVVGRWAVGIDVREAAGQAPGLAERAAQGVFHAGADFGVEIRPFVPSDGRLEGVGEQAEAGGEASVDADEGVAPSAHGAASSGGSAVAVVDEDVGVVHFAAVAARDAHRGLHIAALGHFAGLEADDEQRPAAIEAGGELGLGGIENAQIGRPELGLDDLAHRLAASAPRREGHAGRGPAFRARLQAQPAFADDAKRAFGTQHQAIGTRAGAASRQTARLEPASWREHSRRFDEVVDVGVVGGVVAAGARGHPAADGGPRKALRKVAQRQALRLQGRFQVWAQHSRLNAHGAGDVVHFEHGVHVVEIDGDHRRGIVRRIDAPDHRRAAAVGHDGVAFAVAPGQRGLELVFVARMGNRIRRMVELAAQPFE